MSLGSIARELSKLERFDEPKLELEQYPTPGQLAAQLVWTAYLAGDIEDKRIVDLGAGTGVLGIGALLAGASHVTFVEVDNDAIEILKRNLEPYDESRYEIRQGRAEGLDARFDTVIMNPPFGAQQRHADRAFLTTAIHSAHVVYSIHNANAERFIRSFASDEGWSLELIGSRELTLDHAFDHHRKPSRDQSVILVRLTRGAS